jgi:hypothetical protein
VAEEDLTSALQDMVSVESSYQNAINGELNGSGGNEEEEIGEDVYEEGVGAQQDDEDAGSTGHPAADDDDDMAWVDSFILKTRRSGGRQTETSVLKTYKVRFHLWIFALVG